ncbi:MAG: InlB B-repeat-containing protein, partial [Muribaculaceae bacterium]|nr:InlB B-repeat-containing protein [Muribaculaceae bacterium]
AFSGNYEATEFNVVYKVDGEVVYEAKVKIGEAVPAYEAAEKEGYSFSGWGEVPSVMPAQDLEFSGNYTVNSYKLVFKASENVIFEGELTYGTEISIPEAPEMEGHTFLGWKDVPATMPARDLVFESSYSVNVYTVKFLIDNQEFASVQYEFGAPIVAPEAPEQEGHSFSGWGDIPATMPSHDMVFGGTYAENFYTVTFRLDGTVLFTDDVEYGSEISVPSVPEREGYTFNGWGGEIPAVMPAYNLEYDGSYTANNYAVSFKIGDEVIYSGTLAYGSEVVAPDAPVKEGHTFGGWGVVPATMPAGDLEITGSYEVNYYTVSYMVDGEVFNSATMAYGTELIAPDAPAKEGHSFVGWSNLPAAVPAYDILIDGTYSVNNYNLVFRIGDEEIFSGAIAYGSAVVAPEAPAKEGHT